MPKNYYKSRAAVREQRYQLKQAKQRQSLQNLELKPLLQINYSTRTGQFLGWLMLTAILCESITQADAVDLQEVEQNAAKRPQIYNQNNLVEVDLAPLSSPSLLENLRTQSLEICNHIIALSHSTIPVRCSNEAQQEYERDPELFEQDTRNIKTLIETISSNKKVACKIEAGSQHELFEIQLVTPSEMAKENHLAVAAYKWYPKPYIMFSKNMNISSNYDTVRHEFHHRFISARNERIKRHYYANEKISFFTPCIDLNQPQPFFELVTEGLIKIQNYLRLIDYRDAIQAKRKNNKPIARPLLIDSEEHKANLNDMAKEKNNKFNQYDQQSLKQLMVLTADYKPALLKIRFKWNELKKYLGTRDLIDINNGITQKSSNYIMTPAKIKMYISSVEKVNDHLFVTTASTVDQITPDNRMKAALLDGYYFLVDMVPKYENIASAPCGSIIPEADAYLHENYELYPKLFKHLFPQLTAFHEAEDQEILGSCMKR